MLQPVQQSIKPQFHYTYKSQSVILDSQYNYQGNILAVSNSQGFILFYFSQGEQTAKQPYFIYSNETKKQNKNCAILKIAWSLPPVTMFASCNIYQNVSLYRVKNKTLSLYKQIQCDSIPISLTFFPSQVQSLLTVGFSDGCVRIYNSELQVIQTVQAHLEVVNSLAWETNIYRYEKNKWVQDNFINLHKKFLNSSFLLSCSSDMDIKLWKFSHNKLKFLGVCEKAHDKHVRMVDWKCHYFNQQQRIFASCSQDYTVKIWSVKISEDKCEFTMKGSTVMKGPVYKAKYNFIGNLLAISYCNEQEQKVQTKIFKEINGTLCQELKIQN